MANPVKLEEKINRLKKTISEKREGKSGTETSMQLRPFRKRLKRLQRRRRVLLSSLEHGTKVKGEKAEKEGKAAPKPPAPEKPTVDKEAKAG
ncbi:MAG TPA: hypothetical protein VMN77_05850 [Nitrospiria bacterium]|jgi:hypothetical protein|nr:hypothetical protein [Nitrospiria bacterium]